MERIRIFLGSSIDDLRTERLELAGFVARLNNRLVREGVFIELYECEETPSMMRAGGSQTMHDEYIERKADAALFVFAHRAGQYTLGELDLAMGTHAATGRPRVVAIFKAWSGHSDPSPGIQACIERVTGEYGLPLRLFEDVEAAELVFLELVWEELAQRPGLWRARPTLDEFRAELQARARPTE